MIAAAVTFFLHIGRSGRINPASTPSSDEENGGSSFARASLERGYVKKQHNIKKKTNRLFIDRLFQPTGKQWLLLNKQEIRINQWFD